MTPLLSAFAARKVSNLPQPDSVHVTIVTNSAQRDGERNTAAPSRSKKRKKSSANASNRAGSEEQDPRLSYPAADVQPQTDTHSLIDKSSTLSKYESSVSTALDSSVDAVRQFCTFTPSSKNMIKETNRDWTVSLSGQDSLALIGQYDLWVRKGVVTMYGAALHASSKLHRVYAPSTHPIPVIRPVTNPDGSYGQRAEIEIRSSKSRIRMLREISPKFERIWNAPSSDNTPGPSFALLQTSADDPFQRPLCSLSLPIDWQAVIQGLMVPCVASQKPIVLVCGPKGSGKSTFCQTLVNTILTRPRSDINSTSFESIERPSVAFFDIDPGQPQYVVPGQVALSELRRCNFGPPFTHPIIDPASGNRLVQLQCYGYLSPKDDPTHYLDCVLRIHDSYRKLCGNLPAVINCSGWIQGSGLELLSNLIQQLNVSDVVYVSDGSGPEDVLATLAKICSERTIHLHPLQSTPLRVAARTAAELRMMQTFSYMHLADSEAGELRWDYKPLNEIAPIVIHYSGPKQCILAVMVLGDKQNPDFYDVVLNGCLVDIVVIDDDSALTETEPASSKTQSRESDDNQETPDYCYHPSILRNALSIPYIAAKDRTVRPLHPKYTHSIGQALIRSIDTQNHEFHLLMPVSFTMPSIRQHAKQKIVLVRDKFDAPTWAYEEQHNLDNTRRKRREEHFGIKEGEDEEALQRFAQNTPWASLVKERGGAGAKKRSGRRDLRYKSQAKDE